jgi:hypothetical protein
MHTVPKDILLYVCRKLDAIDIISTALACKKFHLILRPMIQDIISKYKGLSAHELIVKASEDCDLSLVKLAVDKGADEYWKSACVASSKGRLDIVKYLCTYKFNMEWCLIYAVRGGNIEIIEYFISRGVSNINDGLVEASRKGIKHVVLYLISKGANDLDAGLYHAMEAGHSEIVKLLESLGACLRGINSKQIVERFGELSLMLNTQKIEIH